MRNFFLTICILFCFCQKASAGVPALEREITLSLNNERLNSVLIKIQEQTGLIFSYSSDILDNVPPLSLSIKQKTVREALSMILPKSIVFKAKNNYIILKEKPVEKPLKTTELSGYVVDKTTNKKIANVTLYDKSTLQTVTTNEYGFYSINVPKEEKCITINKENYRDTCFSFTYLKSSPLVNILINPVTDAQRALDSITWKNKLSDFSQSTNELFKRFKGYVNTLNVKDTIARNFQVSLIPFLGTNGLLSGNVYNKFSVNIFGGYSRGTTALEVGGFFNIDRENVKGVQAAGFFNVVGDSLTGVQTAGFFNITGKQMTGFQAAGFVNLNLGTTTGMQCAGMANFNHKKVVGVSTAGFLNANRYSVLGAQIAGMLNVTGDTLEGISVAGFANLTWRSKNSLEIAGFLNSVREGLQNTQLAGFMNNTNSGETRLQIASIFNRAHKITGVQLGLINYSDSASGIPIGFLSIVKTGLHQIEVSADEMFYANISLRTGVPLFYNILSAGITRSGVNTLWQIGYGLGTSIKINEKLSTDISASMHHVSSNKFYFATSELYKFYAGLEFKIAEKIKISAGPTFNLYWSDALLPDYKNTYNDVVPYAQFNKSLPNDFNLKGWFGARVALRFL